ncbi:Trk system potassium transporter TrkA [bacterium]|nr:Trk system potassium transporter TrkA [bacterium]
MKILIIGAGEVGGHLARLLSQENHDITVVDQDPERISLLSSTLDVMAIEGQGMSPTVLREAGIETTDMLIAVTTVDEVNILTCMIAKQFGVKTKIARVRNREFSSEQTFLDPADLGIDLIIHPELEAMREVVRLVRYPQVLEMITFCDDTIAIAGLKVIEGSPVAGRTLLDIDKGTKNFRFRLVAINRQGKTIIPRGTDKVEVGDDIYISALHDDLATVFKMAGHRQWETHNVMIYGATSIGRMVAEELEKYRGIRVKLIERNRDRGQEAAEDLESTEVVIGDASDVDLISAEGIVDMDVFAALSDDDEDNVVTSLLARHLKVPKTITLIGKSAYVPIVRTIGLDIAINPRLLTSNAILKYIRIGRIISLRHMAGINAETYEFLVTADSKVVGHKLKDIKFPTGSIVVAVEHEDSGEIPVGDTHIYVGDRVVVFCLPEAVNKVLKLFS